MTRAEVAGSPAPPFVPSTSAAEAGAICAVAGQSQRQMREWASAYPALYAVSPFDPALFSTLSLAAAFSGPGLTADQLRMANRVCLWCFGLDWLVDYVFTTEEQISALVQRCQSVVDGTLTSAGAARPPAPEPTPTLNDDSAAALDDLELFLIDIRRELAAAPAFTDLGDVWRAEFRLMVEAMAREWRWKADRDGGMGRGPTFDEYLANADNLGFSFVLASHWIANGGGGDIDGVRTASRAVQRVIRLLNDLGTYDRDIRWGDLNGLLLDRTRSEVERQVIVLAEHARAAIQDIRHECPALASYMERQMDFCAGFYGSADFWGAL
ncbi:hypothetical protein ACGFNU_06775 [Spirillospora sp. NPDC048911]|uniref:terpene synthase family protein n=1 Tax=Spirillospora sp. NPDC048911 TaxID=3364527 RepID=UPI0037103DDE